MSPEEAVKKLIAEIRADRKQRADDLRSFCAAIDERLVQFRQESAATRDEIIGLKLVLSDTRRDLETARKDIAEQETKLRMVADYTGVTKVGNGHGRKR